MSFFDSLHMSASGLTAERLRMDVIAQNIANVNTTKAADGNPYKRKIVLFEERTNNRFQNVLKNEMNQSQTGIGAGGVRASRIVEDETPGAKVYEPNHPDADADGYVTKPNVNIVTEMVNMISATRAYEANVTAMSATKAMISKTLEISR